MADLKNIEKYLKDKQLSYEVISLGGEVFTVKGVVESGVNRDEIVKTLIIRFKPNSSPGLELERSYAALVVRGKDRVDFKKIRELFGSKSELAKPGQVWKFVKYPSVLFVLSYLIFLFILTIR